jgi:RNA polymerase sigma-70 factor (ECF subfamily)|tara:strand:- start:50 stop:592 length:543 start_codon:yes stop_codon:yes gene_type:complete
VVDSAQAFPSAWGRWSGDYPRDDTALLDRLRAGDDSALSALHERHVRVVHGVVTDLVAAQPDAEEVTHDAFLTLWRKSRRITFVGASCLPWLVVTADTRARELAHPDRSSRRHRAAVDTLDRAGELADSRGSDGWREVQRIVATLSWPDREVFRLCAVDGLSYRQAVRRVSDSVGDRRGR